MKLYGLLLITQVAFLSKSKDILSLQNVSELLDYSKFSTRNEQNLFGVNT